MRVRVIKRYSECFKRQVVDELESGRRTVPLPEALLKKGGRLVLTERRQGGNIIFFTVQATFAGLHSRRTLEFQYASHNWRLMRVAIPGSSFGAATFRQPA